MSAINTDEGTILEALNNKSDRDLHNVDTTAKADAVIDYQIPTAENNYTWYRKYASGWVEQGGNIPINVTSINLLVEMAYDDYECIVMPRKSIATNNVIWKELCSNSQTTTGFTVTSFSATPRNWEVKGMAAA